MTVRRSGVRVRKSVVDRPERRVTFAIESDCDVPIAVRVRETLPDGVSVPSIEFFTEHEGDNWHLSDRGWIEFRRVVAPGDVLTTAYVVPDAIARRRFDSVPEIAAVQPVDPGDLDGDGSPLWRSDGGTEPAIRTDDRSSTSKYDREDPIEQTTPPNAGEVLVAIPAYNEGGSIAAVVTETRAHADAVVVIDDGSADDTAERARAAGAEVVTHKRNKGYGGALKTAFEEAHRRGAAHLVVIDGDGQHDPADIPRLVAHQRTENAEIVIGSRFADGYRSSIPLYRYLGLRAINLLTNVSCGTVSSRLRISDTQCGFRVYDERAIDSLANDVSIGAGMNASVDILHHARRHGYAVEEVGTTVSYDVENASTHNPVSHGLNLVSTLLVTIEREHPVASLGVPGFLSSFVGLAFAYWAVVNYVQSETFPLGIALVSTLFVLGGLLACFTAIVLHSLNTHSVDPGSGRLLSE